MIAGIKLFRSPRCHQGTVIIVVIAVVIVNERLRWVGGRRKGGRMSGWLGGWGAGHLAGPTFKRKEAFPKLAEHVVATLLVLRVHPGHFLLTLRGARLEGSNARAELGPLQGPWACWT